jgi:hypothetical protein
MMNESEADMNIGQHSEYCKNTTSGTGRPRILRVHGERNNSLKSSGDLHLS